MKLIANNLLKIRKINGLSQQQLADKAGLSRTTIANIERDRYNPGVETLELLSNILGVHIKEFFQ